MSKIYSVKSRQFCFNSAKRKHRVRTAKSAYHIFILKVHTTWNLWLLVLLSYIETRQKRSYKVAPYYNFTIIVIIQSEEKKRGLVDLDLSYSVICWRYVCFCQVGYGVYSSRALFRKKTCCELTKHFLPWKNNSCE